MQSYDYNQPAFESPLISEPVRKNFQALATCHAGDNPPPQIWEGMLWLRTTDGALLQYYAGSWSIVHAHVDSGLGRVYRKRLTADDINNKYIILPPPWVSEDQIMVHVEGAPILKKDIDYYIESNLVKWDSKELELVLQVGDVIVIQY